MTGKKKSKVSNIFRVVILFTLLLFSTAQPLFSNHIFPGQFEPKKLAAIGKKILFGRENPREVLAKGGLPTGKGACPVCHLFFPEQVDQILRGPTLVGAQIRSGLRVKEERYRKFSEGYAEKGEPETGIKPHATNAGEYLIESLYCPTCYVRQGYGVKGSTVGIEGLDSMRSAMPRINQPPFNLTDFEIVAVVSYLQIADTPGDYSNITAKEDWEHYFKTKLIVPEDYIIFPHDYAEIWEEQENLLLPDDSPLKIIDKLRCTACHFLPGHNFSQWNPDGPSLNINLSERLESAEYRKAAKEGKAHARTPREYLIESIVDPGAFIVPGFPDGMLKNYGSRLTAPELKKIVDFLLLYEEGSKSDERGKDGYGVFPPERK